MRRILGLKVVALKGYTTKRELRKKKPIVPIDYILFDDGETYIYLKEQDYYDYHDCASWARIITAHKDKEVYDRILSDDMLVDSTVDNFHY